MDRTAWIVVTFCVIGLVAWTWWTGQHAPPRPAAPALSSVTPAPPNASTSPTPLAPPSSTATAVPVPTATPVAEPTPAFAEKTETLRNDDVEIRLTNRGGGIRDAVLLNHIAQGDQRVTIKSQEQLPIGAMIEQPNAPRVEEF